MFQLLRDYISQSAQEIFLRVVGREGLTNCQAFSLMLVMEPWTKFFFLLSWGYGSVIVLSTCVVWIWRRLMIVFPKALEGGGGVLQESGGLVSILGAILGTKSSSLMVQVGLSQG